MKNNRITARDIAKELGVSISTVGRAMADDPRISAATKARVREVSSRLHYVQSMSARVMRGASSKLVALVVPNISNDFYSTIAQSLSTCCERRGYRLVLSITGDNRDVEANHVRELTGINVAGIFIVPSADTRQETSALLSAIPHVQLLRKSEKLGAVWFGIDDERCLHDSTAHLLALGHRRIAYVGGLPKISTGPSRRKGFRRAFIEAGIDKSAALEQLGPLTLEFGAKAAQVLLQRDDRPTGIVCAAQQITVGLMEALTELQVRVPQDLSVVGFGDSMLAKLWGPGLTTIRFPIDELATACALWFLDRLSTQASLPESHSLSTSSSLIVRGSTAPPAR